MGLAWDGVLRNGAPADLIHLRKGWPELLAIPSARRVLAGGSGLTISLLAISRLPIQPTVREGN